MKNYIAWLIDKKKKGLVGNTLAYCIMKEKKSI